MTASKRQYKQDDIVPYCPTCRYIVSDKEVHAVVQRSDGSVLRAFHFPKCSQTTEIIFQKKRECGLLVNKTKYSRSEDYQND